MKLQPLLRAASAGAALIFLLMGLVFLLAPGRLMTQFGVQPLGNGGFSTLRGDLGALFIAAAVFAFAGTVQANSQWLSVSAFLIGMVAFGRTVSLIADGFAPETVQALVAELIMAAILMATAWSVRQGARGRVLLWIFIALAPLALVLLAWTFQRPIGLALFQRAIERTVSAQQLLPSLPDGLHAGLCGSGSPLADPNRAGPCVFVIAAKHMFVVDSGEGSPRKLFLMGLPPAQLDAVLLTHFHSDHIGGLGELMLQRWAGAGHADPLPVYGPQGVESVVAGFNDAYALDKKYRVAHHGEATVPPSGAGGVAHTFTVNGDASQVVLEIDGLTITAFAVPHAPVYPAVGYRFDYKGRSVVISGDTSPSANLAKYAQGADVLFHEGLQTAMVSVMQESTARNGRKVAAKILSDIPPYHTTPEDAARLAARAGVRQLVFYHSIPPLPYAYLNAAFLGDAPRLFKGPITVGKDGLLLSLRPGSALVTMRELL